MADRDWGAYGAALRERLLPFWPVGAVVALVAMFVWGRTEPAPLASNLASPQCSYIQQDKVRQKIGAPTIVVCVEKEADPPEYYADSQLRQGKWLALVPAIRHLFNRTATDPIAGFTGLLFLSTALLWWATEKTINHARKANEQELRAYLSIELGSIENARAGLVPSISAKIRNVGKTPAYNMSIGARVYLIDAVNAEHFYQPERHDLQRTPITMGPGVERVFKVEAGAILADAH